MKMTLFESFGPIVASRNVPFICLWVRNPACTLQAWMGDNRESKLRPKKHCKSSPFLPFANRIPSIEKCVNFATLAIFGSILPYLFSNILNLPHIGDFFDREKFLVILRIRICIWCILCFKLLQGMELGHTTFSNFYVFRCILWFKWYWGWNWVRLNLIRLIWYEIWYESWYENWCEN